MAAEMAVESTVTEDNQTMVKEETLEETVRDAVSAATDLAGHSLKTAKEDLSEMVKEDLSEIVKEKVSEAEKDAASAATDLADHSLKAAKEDSHSETEDPADSKTLERRVSTRKTSTISAMKMKAESTR